MKHGDQKKIARRAEISEALLSAILLDQKRPSWTTAKRLAAVTNTDPVIWMESTGEKIKEAISLNNAEER